ncbi:hypothetical protein PENTCL1PPCAC_13418, partial [Pristionchus entomophagus]
ICYFAVERKQPVEIVPREAHSVVSTTCGGKQYEYTRMRDLEMNRFSQFSTVNELELVIARGAGQFVQATPQYARRNFSEQWICKDHLNELSRRWKSKEWQRHILRRNGKKGMEDLCGIPTHEPPRAIGRSDSILTKEQAEKFLHHNHQLFHVGIPICRDHVEYINNLPAVSTVASPNDSVDDEFNASAPEMVDAEKEELQRAFVDFTEK